MLYNLIFKSSPMHPYIPHLLSDITAAHRTEIPEDKFPQTIEEHFEEIDKWVKWSRA
jgi:hypothetical protein